MLASSGPGTATPWRLRAPARWDDDAAAADNDDALSPPLTPHQDGDGCGENEAEERCGLLGDIAIASADACAIVARLSCEGMNSTVRPPPAAALHTGHGCGTA
jgi:hypothetical protein